MVFNKYTQLRILQLNSRGIRPPTIAKRLASEGITVSRKGVAKFIKKFAATGKTTSEFIAFLRRLLLKVP